MKFLSPSLKASFESDSSTLARIITIYLLNDTILRYTDLDREIKVGAFVHTSAGLDASAIRQSSIGGGNGGTMTLVLDNENDVTEEMVRSRALSGARYVLEAIDYVHPEYGTMILGTGQFGTIDFNERGECSIDLDGLLTQGARTIGEVYSQECRNDFGDQYCQFPVETLRVEFIIDEVFNVQSFIADELAAADDDVWASGVVTFSDGDNAGQSIEVAISQADGSIDLALPPPYVINPGDAASIVPGCSKQRSQCRGSYDNLMNYRGEPDVPTIDQQQIPVSLDASSTPPPSSALTIVKAPTFAKTVT